MKISRSKQFKKDFRNYIGKMSDKHFESLIEALNCLKESKQMPKYFREYELSGRLKGYRELHLGGDLLLMYVIKDEVIYLLRMGTHAEILGM